MEPCLNLLLNSVEPSVRWKAWVGLVGLPADAPEVLAARQAVRESARVRALLSECGPDGRIPYAPYSKWYGAHWVLAALADLGYPTGDESLLPMCNQMCEWLFSQIRFAGIHALEGRVRCCASQEGNALYSMLALELADERADQLAARLMSWQWPDGGWNCDKNPSADTSSFMESLIPMRALALYAQRTGSGEARDAVERAAEVFLSRSLYMRRSDGRLIRPEFTQLFYPTYWHYNILFGLKVMSEVGLLKDSRCSAALDLLESKRLPDGSFSAEKCYEHHRNSPAMGQHVSGWSSVSWGPHGAKRMNEFITVDALSVLVAAGRAR